MSKKKPLIVNELQIKNVGPIKNIHVIPKGDVTYLTGPNGAGKTFALDSISYALSGARSFSGIEKVIRDGAESAEILVDLGDYRVLREWKSEDDYRLKMVRVMEDGEELTVNAPQSVLDSFGKTIGVDPLELSQKHNADLRREFLLAFVDINLDELELERQVHYNERTQANREAKEAETKLKDYGDLPEELPEKIDVSDELNRLEKIQQHNQKVDTKVSKLTDKKESAERGKKQVEELRKQLEQAEKQLAELNEDIQFDEKWIADNSKKDTKPVNDKIAEANSIEKLHERADKKQELEKTLKDRRAEAEQLTSQIEQCDKKKIKAVEKADLPLGGLGIGEADITIQGRAFAQYSEGERIRYATAMLIGSEPRFKVIGVKGAHALDSKNQQIIQDLAREHGFQLWIEKMDESGEVGFVFEEGEIVKENTKE